MRVEITCIRKKQHHNPHERIHSIGGRNPDGTRWELTEQQAINGIKDGKYSFFVNVNGRLVNVIIAVYLGR